MDRKSAIAAINRMGALLVFPIDNRKEPASLWSHFYPRSEMRWEWDESGDDRVVNLWHLKTELSTTRKVVYSKWFRGRATYLSFELFGALLRALNPSGPEYALSADARRILAILEAESPLSTKELKRLTGLQGRANERTYDKALGELWSRCLIVAFGEVEDGAFPSLAVGATRVIFEELWGNAFKLDVKDAVRKIGDLLPQQNLFLRHFLKLKKAQAVPTSRGKGSSRKIGGEIAFDDL